MPPKKKPKKKPRNAKGKSNKASVSQYSVDWLLSQRNLAHNISKPDTLYEQREYSHIYENQVGYLNYLISKKQDEPKWSTEFQETPTDLVDAELDRPKDPPCVETNTQVKKRAPPSCKISWETGTLVVKYPERYRNYRNYNKLDPKYGIYWCRDCVEYNGYSIEGNIHHCWNCYMYLPDVR